MISISVKGLDELQAKFKNLPKEVQKIASASLEEGARLFVRGAQRDAPVNFGVLRQGISYLKTQELSFTVVSNAFYSPYNEWGTITRVRVPASEAAYASTFKGRGLRKTGGMFPHPFFFKQILPTKAQIEKDLQKINDIKL